MIEQRYKRRNCQNKLQTKSYQHHYRDSLPLPLWSVTIWVKISPAPGNIHQRLKSCKRIRKKSTELQPSCWLLDLSPLSARTFINIWKTDVRNISILRDNTFVVHRKYSLCSAHHFTVGAVLRIQRHISSHSYHRYFQLVPSLRPNLSENHHDSHDAHISVIF
jgi:hypothetical protein